MKSNYDLIYQMEYDRVFLSLSSKVITALKNPTKNTLLFKKDLLLNELNDVFKAMTWKQISPGGYMPDQYTERLLSDFKFHIDDYLEDKITNFIADHLEKIKDVFKDVELSIPSNIKLNARETVELIAKHNAHQKFIQKVYSIDKNDTIEICERKISIDGYVPPVVKVESDDLNKIEWLGTQKELGELFVELFRKGWISSIDDKLISSYFTNSNTISQILKKEKIDKNTKDYLYESIYTAKYSKKFDGIKIKKTNKKVN